MTPFGDIVVAPARGLVYGNRGCLHDARGEIRRPFDGKRWIACRLEFRGRRRAKLQQPGRYTELFFLDEATALAAGHRPCRECRYRDYESFVTLWHELFRRGRPGAGALDEQLHLERVYPATRGQRRHAAPFADLPDGTFVALDGHPLVVLGDALLAWSPSGYGERRARPRTGATEVVTPPSLVRVLAAGWRSSLPLLHPSATA
jgi:hypothetical protein